MSTQAPSSSSSALIDARRTLASTLRKLGLMPLVERVRFGLSVLNTARRNAEFDTEGRPMPPRRLLFETSTKTCYRTYFESGQDALSGLIAEAGAAAPGLFDRPDLSILDYGCGVGRIVRHWGERMPEAIVHGVDIHPGAIAWNQAHIPQVSFARIEPDTPLVFAPDSFDFLYAISVLTHTPPDRFNAMFSDMARILRPGGVAAVSLQGKTAFHTFSPAEHQKWNEGEAFAREKAAHGSRLYATYAPRAYVERTLPPSLAILAHIERARSANYGQDLYLLQKQAPQSAP